MKNAAMILELIGELIRERNQLREAVSAVKRELSGLQIERDELRVKIRRMETERAAEKPTTREIA
jgi:regulator of replication initiation timing